MNDTYLSNKYYGKHDELILKSIIYKNFTELKGSYQFGISHKFPNNENNFKIKTFTLPLLKGFGFSNLKIKNVKSPLNIKRIDVEIDNIRFDINWPAVSGNFDINLFNDTIIISSKENQIKIIIEYKDELELTFDCMKLENYDAINENYDFVFRSMQYTGIETINNIGQTKIKQSFNFPIYEINVYTKHIISNVKMIFDDDEQNILEFEQENENKFSYKFIKPVNFTKIDKQLLLFNNNILDNEIHIVAKFICMGTYSKKNETYDSLFF